MNKSNNLKKYNKMKIFKIITIGMVLLFVTSCATSVKFPISKFVPAAEIAANKKKDNNNNYDIKVSAKYLANPNRLDPPKNFYVVWIVTKNDGIKNIGQMIQKGTERVVLTTTTPFTFKEIFITAEEKGDVTFPTGIEITRKKWK